MITQRRRITYIFFATLPIFLYWSGVMAAEPVDHGGSHGLSSSLLIGLAAIWAAAKVGGELFERLGQPAVLGELIAGIILGNLALVGFGGIEPLKNDAVIAALAEI